MKFTAHMEENLDKVESREKEFIQVTQEFYTPFLKALQEFNSKKDEIKVALQEETREKCPQCGSDLIIRWGRNGKFVGCSNYPECKYTKPTTESEEVDEYCVKCGRKMVIKHGRYGRFLACSGYPECKNTQPLSIGVSCPKENCSGFIVEKRSKRGRVFYGCSRYPECKFASWNKPVSISCPTCKNPYLEERSTQAKGEYLLCSMCKSEFPMEMKESYEAVA